jgi:predicted pyridoxine 5'-phosphate oxidase superfamily flavin-nucleotide-binding protein
MIRQRWSALKAGIKRRLQALRLPPGWRRDPYLHRGELEAQVRFGTREAWQDQIPRFILTRIEPDYREFILKREYFFIATADFRGHCDCAFRGIDPKAKAAGFPALCIPDPHTLCFPDYPGNGVFQSIGNLLTNPRIGILFIDFENSQRVRVNGKAQVVSDEHQAQQWFGPSARRLIVVSVEEVFANCRKYFPARET